jgi:hypothetical protein
MSKWNVAIGQGETTNESSQWKSAHITRNPNARWCSMLLGAAEAVTITLLMPHCAAEPSAKATNRVAMPK